MNSNILNIFDDNDNSEIIIYVVYENMFLNEPKIIKAFENNTDAHNFALSRNYHVIETVLEKNKNIVYSPTERKTFINNYDDYKLTEQFYFPVPNTPPKISQIELIPDDIFERYS